MIDLRHIHSLTDFLRNHKAHVKRLQEGETAEVLTVNGKPELVLLTADGYQTLVDRLDYAERLAGLRKAYRQVQAGETEEYGAAIEALKAKHGF